jgi:hypothetical protein
VLSQGPDSVELMWLYFGIGHVALEMTQVAEGLAASRRAMEIAERLTDDVRWAGWAGAAGEYLWLLFASGHIAEAFAFADQAYQKISRLNNPNAEGVLHYAALMR